MATTYQARFLAIHADTQRALTSAFDVLAERMRGAVKTLSAQYPRQVETRNGIEQGIALAALDHFGEVVHPIMREFFIGPPDRPEALVVHHNSVLPLSTFARLLWPAVEAAGKLALERQWNEIDKVLARAPDVQRQWRVLFGILRDEVVSETRWREQFIMQYGGGRALIQEHTHQGRQVVREQGPFDDPLFLATYEAPHTWVDPNGYTLSERIWNTDQASREKLHLYMQDAIRAGKSSAQIASEVTKFLKPGQYLPTTNKPYGTNLSYNAMRLGRTEISAAYHQTNMAAARANPFVQQYQPVRTRYASPCMVCDSKVEDGPYPITTDEGRPPFHPHCLCDFLLLAGEEPVDDMIDRMRAALRDQHPERFDANGAMNLAHKIRVNTFKWQPGQVGVVDAELAVSILGTAPAPTVPPLEQGGQLGLTYSGTYEGDLYIHMGAHERDKYGDNWRQALSESESRRRRITDRWGLRDAVIDTQYHEGLQPIFRGDPDARLYRIKANSLRVGSRADWDTLVARADEAAYKSWKASGRGPFYTIAETTEWELHLLTTIDDMVAASEFDAFIIKENSLWVHPTAIKNQLAQVVQYTADDLLALERAKYVQKPLAEALQDAAERIGAARGVVSDTVVEIGRLNREIIDLQKQQGPLLDRRYDMIKERSAARAAGDAELMEAITAQIEQFDREMFDAVDDQIAALRKQAKALERGVTAELKMVLHGETGVAPKIDWQDLSRGKNHTRFKSAMEDAASLFNADLYDVDFKVFRTDRLRSHATDGVGVFMNRDAASKVAVHEMGHFFQYQNPHIHERAVEYLLAHWEPGAEPELLSAITGAKYKANERAIRGDFFSPYVGKLYGTGRDNVWSSEVISMGLEELWHRPMWLLDRDPALFDFMVALCAGWI